MKLFEETVMSATEMDIVKQCLGNPSVVKYIRGLAQDAAMQLASTPTATNLNADDLRAQVAFIQGNVAFGQELLNLAVPLPTPEA